MTSKAGHTFTAGPWELRSVTCKSGRNKLALRASGRHICDISIYDDEDEATARLIAAAPELLEALQGLVRFTDAVRVQVGMGKTQLERLAKARAAIAKATAGGAV